MEYTVTIETENAAFDGEVEQEVARILRVAATDVETQGLISPISLYDSNGNRIGEARWAEATGRSGSIT